MHKQLKSFATMLMVAAVTIPYAAQAQPATYPNRPITMVVPFPAGNVTDAQARVVASALSTQLGQQVLIENKAGAAGIIGTQYVANAKPDGYTMLWGSSGPLVSHPFVYKKLPYSAQSLAPVNAIAAMPLLLVVNSSKPYKTLEEFVAYAKKNPGKVTFGSPGVGTGSHLAGELFQATTGTKMLHVPYKDSGGLYGDLLGGRTDAVFDFTPVMRQHMKSGTVIGIGITSENRIRDISEVPTFKEKGYDVTMTAWSAVMMPAGTPPAIIQRMSEAIQIAMKSPEAVRLEREYDMVSLSGLGPEALKKFMAAESVIYRDVVTRANVSVDN